MTFTFYCCTFVLMCVVSMIGDHFTDKWSAPEYQPLLGNFHNITRKEFEDLKKEVLEMKELLKKAKQYDEKNNEPNCEVESKMATLRKIAELVGVNIDDILKP